MDALVNVFLRRAVETAMVGMIAAVVAWFKWSPRGAAGLLAGVPVAILGLWLLMKAFQMMPDGDWQAARRRAIQLCLLRMAIDFGVIIAATAGGEEFLLGVFGGLLCQAVPFLIGFLLSPFVQKVTLEE